MRRKTHKCTSEYALKFLSDKELLENKNMFLRGVLNEDFFCFDKKIIRIRSACISHFYHPLKKQGFLLNIFGNAITEGLKRYSEAKKCYLKGDLKNAYYNLGRAVHLLQDIAAPVHNHLVVHGFFDRFEVYLNKNCEYIKLPKLKKIIFKNIEDYYKNIAAGTFNFEFERKFNPIWQMKRFIGIEKKLSKKQLQEQAKQIFPLIVFYTCGLIEHFLKEVRK